MPGVSNPVPEASSTVPGITEYATTGEAQSGTATDKAMTPANVTSAFPNRLLDNLGYNDIYKSAEQTITSAGSLTLAHGIGRAPLIVLGTLKCKIAQYNYSVGDEVFLQNFMYSSTTNDTRGVCVHADATYIYARYSSFSSVFTVLDATTGVLRNITKANWRLKLYAWG